MRTPHPAAFDTADPRTTAQDGPGSLVWLIASLADIPSQPPRPAGGTR